jgi:hypothetical protein
MMSTARRISGSQPRASSAAARSTREGLAATIEHLSGRRQHGLASLQLEHLHAEQFLELLDRVGHCRLRAVQPFRRLRIATGLDHGDERAPLVQRDLR